MIQSVTIGLRLIGATVLFFGASLSLHSLGGPQAATALPASPSTGQIQNYSAIQSSLPAQTGVPVRLPSFIPLYADKDNPIYAIVDSVTQTEYRVQLAWAKNCAGQNWCHLGEITGSTAPQQFSSHQSTVRLGPELTAYFVDFTCGAYCDDAVIYWAEDGYYYSIAMKGGKRQTLLKMARSAVAARRVQSP